MRGSSWCPISPRKVSHRDDVADGGHHEYSKNVTHKSVELFYFED